MEILGEFKEELSEYYFEQALNNENWIKAFATIKTGKESKDKLGLIKSLGYQLGVADQCDPEYTAPNLFSNKEWDINNIGLNIKLCESDIKAEMLRGTAPFSYDAPEIMEVIQKLVSRALVDSQLYNAFFGDKGNSSQTEASLKLNKGWLQRIDSIVTADGDRRTTIPTNSKSALRTGMAAAQVLDDLIEDSDKKLRGTDMEIICNQALWDAVMHNVRMANGTYTEMGFESLFNGIKKYTWNSVPVFVIPALDQIQAVATTAPHAGDYGFAIATSKDNMVLGMRENENLGNVDYIVDKVKKTLFVPASYSIDTNFVDDEMVQIAY